MSDDADTPQKCPSCGEPLPPEAPQGLCPKCLLSDVAQQKAPPPGEASLEEVQENFPELEILELVGFGGIGRVYRVRDPRVDRVVALKVLSPDRVEDPEWIERFTREAKALARLNHPHIVQVHSFGTDPQPHLLMEYVEGVNLRQAMESGGLSAREALVIVPKLCDALHYAHEHGVLHRDIKPENILIDTEGRVKLVDFGLAKLHGEGVLPFTLTQSGEKLGTLAYMAPEQVEKPSDVDHRADIYSLGVVFYEMLTGELPLGRFPSPSEANGTDPRLDGVVLRTLEKKRENRFPDAGAMASGIEQASKGKMPRKHRFHLQTALVVVLALVALATGIGWLQAARVRAEERRAQAEAVAQQENAERVRQEKRESLIRSREMAQGWINGASRTDDWDAKEKAIQGMLAAIQSDDPITIKAALDAFTYLGKIKMERSQFQETFRKLIRNEDWEIRNKAISALFATDFNQSDIDAVLGMIDEVPDEYLHSLSGAISAAAERDFTGKYEKPILALLKKGFEAEKKRPPSVTWMNNRYLLGVLWGARVTPAIEELIIEWTRLDTTEDKDMNTNSRGYYAFYSALSVFANKTTPSVKRLLELASNPDMTNIAGRCFWGLNGTVSDKEDQQLVADGLIRILSQRDDSYMWRRGLQLLDNVATSDQLFGLKELAARPELPDENRKSLESIIEKLSQ